MHYGYAVAEKKIILPKKSTTISMYDNMITGNQRKEIKEQIRIFKTKSRAQNHPYHWRVNTEEIEWKYMKKNWRKRTLKEKLQNIKLMNGKRATKEFLYRFKFTHSSECILCKKGEWKQTDM